MNASAIGRTLLREIWWHTVSIVSLMTSDDRRTKAYKRGLELLKADLTPAQLNQFLTERSFEVVGGVSGRRYRISLTGPINIEELDQAGRCARRLCFLPAARLVGGDVVLAQKVALETSEVEALAVAYKFPASRSVAKLHVDRSQRLLCAVPQEDEVSARR